MVLAVGVKQIDNTMSEKPLLEEIFEKGPDWSLKKRNRMVIFGFGYIQM